MNKINLNKLISVMKKKKYKINRSPLEPNIVGIRKSFPLNIFNDKLILFWKENNDWKIKEYTITTKPGKYYLEHPINPKGTAQVVEGQYLNLWKIGIHGKGTKNIFNALIYNLIKLLTLNKLHLSKLAKRHKALIQINPIKVYRKNDLIEKGNFNINLHRYHPTKTLNEVHNASAGCQVFKNPYEFKEFLKILETKFKYTHYFNYTLINEKEL
jgi:hypothetical protein